jgi:hypothetical protein
VVDLGWLTGYNYRKSHVINQDAGSVAGTNYQVRVHTIQASTYNLGNDDESIYDDGANIEDRIRGSKFFSKGGGTVTEVSGYILVSNGDTAKVKMAIYNYSDSTLVTNGVATEKTISGDGNHNWEAFTFSTNPTLVADTWYVIVAWSEAQVGVDVTLGCELIVGGNRGQYDAETYDGFPDPASFAEETNNYLVYCTITPGTGQTVSLEAHNESDFGDVRFTESDGTTELDYWMESYTASVEANFWVEVSGDLGAGNVTIYIYYGKTGESTASNGANTFLLFDHFDDASLDTALWDESGNGSVSESGTVLEITGWDGVSAKSPHTVTSDNTFGPAVRLRSYMKFHQVALSIWDFFGMRNSDVDNALVSNYSKDKRVQNRKDSSTSDITGITVDLTSYITYEIRLVSGDYVIHDIDNGIENIKHDTDARAPDSAMHVWMRADQDISANAEVYVDWVFVAKYVDPEPAHSTWGSEESAPVAVAGSVSLPTLLRVIGVLKK